MILMLSINLPLGSKRGCLALGFFFFWATPTGGCCSTMVLWPVFTSLFSVKSFSSWMTYSSLYRKIKCGTCCEAVIIIVNIIIIFIN